MPQNNQVNQGKRNKTCLSAHIYTRTQAAAAMPEE